MLRRAYPTYQWSDRPLGHWLKAEVPSQTEAFAKWRRQNAGVFFFDHLPDYPFENLLLLTEAADSVLNGRWPYFANETFDINMPPDWHLNPLTQLHVNTDVHWTQISDFDAGDIKYVWEPSRFTVVYTLVRAYAATGNTAYARAFWDLITDWAEKNPANLGPNWKCGQEATFRVMAWCFGLYAFYDHGTPDQIALLVVMIAAHAERIEKNIDYAYSQNNNHGVSEGMGLWTIGLLFPELNRADHWATLGKTIFEAEVRRQVYADGSYAQHSPNYQRVMLHDAIWALRLGELNKRPFPKDIYEKVADTAHFLLQILDLESGRAPNHGANDSALILPLNDQHSDDFRPVIQAAYYLVYKERLFANTDVNEDIFWLFGPDALANPVSTNLPHQENLAAEIGGFYTLRQSDSWMMVRCADYHSRPHHADQLHLDFWWRGINLCCDAGTYLYNGNPPWQNGLSTTAVHNTVIVDNNDQMTKHSRFLWLNWSCGQLHHHDKAYWEGSHNGYLRLKSPTTHRRGVQFLNDFWVVVDELKSDESHDYLQHWLIPHMPYDVIGTQLTLQTQVGEFFIQFSNSSLVFERATADSVSGWRSSSYGQKESAISLSLGSWGKGNHIFWTILAPRPVKVEEDKGNLLVDGFRLILGNDRLIEVR